MENVHTEKKFTLDLKTTYKKVFLNMLNYQVNTRFPSLCLASENAIFSGGRRRRRRREKKVGKPIGDPIGERDAPIKKLTTWRGFIYKY